MSNDLKYNSSYSNDCDFVQDGDEVRELTVEITLAEYRELIMSQASADARISELEGENARLLKENESIRNYVALKNPEIFKKIKEVFEVVTKIKDDNEGET